MRYRVPGNPGLYLSGCLALLALLAVPARAEGPDPPAAPLTVAPGAGETLEQSESQVASQLAAGHCDLALQTLLTVQPNQRRPHLLIWFCRAYSGCGLPKDTVAACNAVLDTRGTFAVEEYEEARRNSTRALDRHERQTHGISEPNLPRAPHPPLLIPADPPDPAVAQVAAPARWDGLNRVYFHLRPFWSLSNPFGGAMFDFGFEHMHKSGFLFGAELAPVSLTYPYWGVNARLRIGYGGRRFAISLGVGTGYPLLVPQFGLFLRAGRLDRTYVEINLYWAFLAPFPFDGLLHISTPTSQWWRFKLDLGGSLFLYGPYLLMGGERQLRGQGGRGSSAINFGFGLVFSIVGYGIPGPMMSIGYERRF